MCAPGRLTDTGLLTEEDVAQLEARLAKLPPTVSQGSGYFRAYLLSELNVEDAVDVLGFAAGFFD
jgi:hypothetical protein